jgi:hypothetical protein
LDFARRSPAGSKPNLKYRLLVSFWWIEVLGPKLLEQRSAEVGDAVDQTCMGWLGLTTFLPRRPIYFQVLSDSPFKRGEAALRDIHGNDRTLRRVNDIQNFDAVPLPLKLLASVQRAGGRDLQRKCYSSPSFNASLCSRMSQPFNFFAHRA